MLPVIVINGPLGSGKTTLIHSLLKKHINAKKTLWLKTEFGDQSIDEYILSDTGVQTKSLTGGCICHVLLSKLDSVLTQIESVEDVEQVIIETSGMSHPAPVTQAIERHPQFRVAQAVLVVDTTHAHDDNYPKPMILPVGTSAPYDLIIFNKYNLSLSAEEEGELEKVLDPWFAGVYSFIEKLHIPNNTDSPTAFDTNIDSWAEQLHVAMHTALVQSPRNISGAEIKEVDEESTEDHEGDMDVFTFHFESDKIMPREKIETYASSLPAHVVRVKGIFHTKEGSWEFFNWVRGSGTWSPLDSAAGSQLLLVMGKHLTDRNQFSLS